MLPLPSIRTAFAIDIDTELVYGFGGHGGFGGTRESRLSKNVQCYDPHKHRWRIATQAMQVARPRATAVYIPQYYGFIIGSSSDEPLEYYSPSTKRFIVIPIERLSSPNSSDMRAYCLLDNTILISINTSYVGVSTQPLSYMSSAPHRHNYYAHAQQDKGHKPGYMLDLLPYPTIDHLIGTTTCPTAQTSAPHSNHNNYVSNDENNDNDTMNDEQPPSPHAQPLQLLQWCPLPPMLSKDRESICFGHPCIS